MAARIAFPYKPANKFHAGIEARFKAAAETPQSIDRLTDEVKTGSKGTKGAIDKVADAIDELHKTVQSIGLRDKDNVTALYAAAVDTTGDIVGRTIAGQWLNQAGFKSLHDIETFNNRKPQGTRRDDFIKRIRNAGSFSSGLPSVVTDDELARFFELAPAVQKAIDDSQPPTGGQPPPTKKP
ncbi:hypothetical protein EH240_03915 [Mesorhizobium tamadayense]|uniref:Uncharacterized protein n=1 Tax=Mesorhizobium tamadayense TaxID=425306 RepID=A0A3P3G6E3_9HYPH|nr:hypothetical protein [Mesorhizobium tamadayense]RRI06426.1 hypothetical protein EH240_03915 [Mesorhizobium tamadayense]